MHCAENQRSFLSQPKNTAVTLENFKLEISEASQYHKLPLILKPWAYTMYIINGGFRRTYKQRGISICRAKWPLIHCKWNRKSTSKQAMEVLVKIDVRFAFTGF